MTYLFEEAKNEKLRKERNICFDDVISILASGEVLDFMDHPNKNKYPNQKVYVIKFNDYVYTVPCVVTGDVTFLKTIYPSRKYAKIYLKGGSYEK